MCAMCWSCLVFRNIFNAFWFWWLCSTRRWQQQHCGSIIHSQPAFHFNPGLTVSMLLPFKDRVMTKLLVINILYCSKVAAGCLGIWAGSSHCLGWPVLHCVPVDDYAQLYIGATSNPSMQNGTEVGIDWMEKVKVLNLKNLNIWAYRSWREPWDPSWPPITILWSISGPPQVLISAQILSLFNTRMMPLCNIVWKPAFTQGPAIGFLATHVFHLADHLHLHCICLYCQSRETHKLQSL